MIGPIDSFRQAAEARGLFLPNVVADGQLHRCDVEGRNGKGDGVYKLHLDGVPAGGFQNWKDGVGWQNWHHKGQRRVFNSAPRAVRRAAAHGDQRAEQEVRHAAAAEKAAFIWGKAVRLPANQAHPYLASKSIAPFGIGQLSNTLVIPVRAGNGMLQSLQFIDGHGNKRFLRGGRIAGGSHVVGNLTGDVVVIAEGYATAASIHLATGYPVVVAFNCGNLHPVAVLTRQKYPKARIVIAADDDDQTKGNPGLTKAQEAACHVSAHVAIPRKKAE